MNFYYHPIFGLQYTSMGPIMIVDFDALPECYSIEGVLELIHQQGIKFINPTTEHWVNYTHTITSNFNLN